MDIEGQQPLSVSSLSEIGEKKCVYMVVKVFTQYYTYAVYRIEMSGITNSFSISSNNSRPPPISISSLDEPLLLLGSEFLPFMGFFSFGSRIYMLASSEGVKKGEMNSRSRSRSKSVHVFDTVTCAFESAPYDQQMHTEKHNPVVIQPLKPFDDRVFVFSGDSCGEDLEVFYPDDRQCQKKKNNSSSSSSCWTFIGGHPSCCTFPPSCRASIHSTVSEGFVLLTTNMVILLYNIPSGTWTVVEDQSYTTCLSLRHHHRVFAYEIAKWFSFCASSSYVHYRRRRRRSHFLCHYFVDSNNGIHQFGKSPHLYLSDAQPCECNETDYLLYLDNLCFCVVRSGHDRYAGGRHHPNDAFPNHHATVTLFRIDPSANSILEEHSSSYKIIPLDHYEDTDRARVCACFVI